MSSFFLKQLKTRLHKTSIIPIGVLIGEKVTRENRYLLETVWGDGIGSNIKTRNSPWTNGCTPFVRWVNNHHQASHRTNVVSLLPGCLSLTDSIPHQKVSKRIFLENHNGKCFVAQSSIFLPSLKSNRERHILHTRFHSGKEMIPNSSRNR